VICGGVARRSGLFWWTRIVERREDREGVLAESVTGEKAAYVGGAPVGAGVSWVGGDPPSELSSRADMGELTYDSQGVSCGEDHHG
jgi:hypothetical protein